MHSRQNIYLVIQYRVKLYNKNWIVTKTQQIKITYKNLCYEIFKLLAYKLVRFLYQFKLFKTKISNHKAMTK